MSDKVNSLHLQLNKKGYICDDKFSVNLGHAINTKPVGGAFLFGPAGTGKSYLPMILSELLKRELFMYQCSSGTREDDLLLKMLPSEDTVSGIKIEESVVYKAAIKSKDEKVVLVFDEWDKTRPTADGFFLDFLQYGRLSIPGREVGANLNNMLIFFTSNNERDISEALLRRFPKIDVEPLSIDVVYKALNLTHKGHTYIGNILSLYEKTLQSEMTKPATIQELRQLLDAITLLNANGDECDWDTLVYMYVTKTPENHALLSKAISDGSSNNNRGNGRMSIDVDSFSSISTSGVSTTSAKGVMPSLIDINKYDLVVGDTELEVGDEKITCLLEKDDTNYSNSVKTQLVELEGELTGDPADIDWIKSVKGSLISTKPILLCDISKHDRLFADTRNNNTNKAKGEILVFEPNACWDDMIDLISVKSDRLIIRKAEKDEIIGRYAHNSRVHLDFRWTPETGAEIIANASRVGHESIRNFVGDGLAGWYNSNVNFLSKYDVYDALDDNYDRFCDIGELVLKSCIGSSSYANYGINKSPNGCQYCDDIAVPSYEALEKISNVKYGVRFTRYKSSGIVINTYHSKVYGRNHRWDVMVTGPFDSRILRILYMWGLSHFYLYYMCKLPGFDVAKQLVKKYNWKRSSDRNGNRMITNKSYKCFIYPDSLMFAVDITKTKVKRCDNVKLDKYITDVIKWLDGWKGAKK
ncbi:hypothetical protein CMI47_16530 [Candidatus Pacearchaeota archaeon]|jgi:hypothetical protein|nr:hypothetical protein [Candidatus Pacearchaeota archaeon]|tara:strand:- start:8354 stop:10447 length:2094 start_codon:yes stop_codon:yes gene_type:complete